MSISRQIIKKLISQNKDLIGSKSSNLTQLRQPIQRSNEWNWKTSTDLLHRYYECKYLLYEYRFKPYDRVIYKGRNSFDFIAWNLAVNSLGGIWVPVYHNQNEEYLNYIIKDCTPSVLVSDDKTKYDNILCFDADANDGMQYIQNDSIVSKRNVSTLIYTSGTTGNPKGVMLSDDNIISNINGINNRFKEFQVKSLRTLNILPWAHIYSITTELYYNLLNLNQIAISSGPEHFVKELYQVNPNILYLVPKVLELIKTKLEKLDYPIIKHAIPIILKKLFNDDFITIFVGGAKLDDSTFQFYKKHNINICLGYGCSETSPMVSVNHMNDPRNEESVGKLIDDVIVEVLNEEILVSGPNVMKGYWNNQDATNEVLVQHKDKTYYRTGDSGYVKDGYLFLTGRISDNYKMSNGKFVNVENVESKMKENISGNFIVYGEHKDSNILLTDINIKSDTLMKLCNKNLESYLHIKNVLYIEKEVFQKYLTPKMSIKRKKLLNDFREEINALYRR
jgi:long-chain acyl-CoA synthetase